MGNKHSQRQWDPQKEQQPEAWARKPGRDRGSQTPWVAKGVSSWNLCVLEAAGRALRTEIFL